MVYEVILYISKYIGSEFFEGWKHREENW